MEKYLMNLSQPTRFAGGPAPDYRHEEVEISDEIIDNYRKSLGRNQFVFIGEKNLYFQFHDEIPSPCWLSAGYVLRRESGDLR